MVVIVIIVVIVLILFLCLIWIIFSKKKCFICSEFIAHILFDPNCVSRLVDVFYQ